MTALALRFKLIGPKTFGGGYETTGLGMALCIFGGAVAITAAMVLIICILDRASCISQAANYGFPHRWGPLSGCFVRYHGRWYDYDQLRAVPAAMSCPKCHDRGGFRGPRGWVRCTCRKPTREQLAAQRELNSIGAARQLTMAEMLQLGSSPRRDS